jgi:hypothetical protein
MYYDEFFPCYKVYADSHVCREEEIQERENDLLKSWYSERIRSLREAVEEECQRLDYEGSRIYDEYPDRFMLKRDCSRICEKKIKNTDIMDEEAQKFLLETLFWQEISRRRCRRKRFRGW